MKPEILRQETLSEGKFLRLELLHYRDCSGHPRKWEAVQRCTLPQVVVIIATLHPSGEILLIRQFRPPVNAFVLEFPAGLVDPGESVAEAARRELLEETGYIGQVEWQSSPGASSAGLTGELLTNVLMTVEQSCPENQRPRQSLQDGEEIAVFKCQPAALPEFFREQIAGGAVLDSRLSAWACAQGLRW
jgi:ADP-ribose pyrophosphatase